MEKENTDQNTKERIIKATLDTLKKDGIPGFSIRKIVKLAKVNVSAVNYHFGSKDNIINEALKYLIEKINKIFLILEDKTLTPEVRIEKFINGFIDKLYSCPVALKGSMTKMIKEEKLPAELVEDMKRNFDKIFLTIKELNPGSKEIEIKIKMFQLISAIFYPMAIGDYAHKLSDLNLKDKETKNKYIKILINSIKK